MLVAEKISDIASNQSLSAEVVMLVLCLPAVAFLLTCFITLYKSDGSCEKSVAIVDVRISLPSQPFALVDVGFMR